MYLVLLRFWLRRFTFTFAAALLMLFYWNYTHYGFTQNVIINTWTWALVAAVITSSLTTYLAYLRARKATRKAQEKSQEDSPSH
jgi:type VI protein secretion system component VasK